MTPPRDGRSPVIPTMRHLTSRSGKPSARLSICYVVPGHNLMGTAGPSRNVMSLARALSTWADVTVAFRRALEPVGHEPFSVVELEPRPGPSHAVDDAAMAGMGYLEFATYLATLRRFTRDRLSTFDVVLEKSWLLSGHVTAWCRKRGILAIPVENTVPKPSVSLRDPLKAARIWTASRLAGRSLRAAPVVVAETPHLKAALVRRWHIRPERIEVIGLGVDRELFSPGDRAAARRRLRIDAAATVLLYAGVLDHEHDLRPVLQALGGSRRRPLQVHILGDGALRCELERISRAAPGGSVTFHGRVPHAQVPLFIAAADLCLAPYNLHAFVNSTLAYSTMKVREYLAAGRAVAGVASGALTELIQDGVSGFLIEQDVVSWRRLFDGLPSRAQLHEMGLAAAATPLDTWADMAKTYHALCERLLEARLAAGAR